MNNLEYYRRSKGLSQTKLGLKLGIHPTNITMVERGHRIAWPKLRRQLAEALEVPEDDLFDEKGNLRLGAIQNEL